MRTLSTALPLPIVGLMLLSIQARAQSTTILTFEGLPDKSPITTQFAGLVFRNAAVGSAGISLNEFEFPPHAGSNVLFDDGGPVSISFLPPIQSFVGYFTYGTPITIQAFDSAGTRILSASSLFFSNEALSGVPGSSPLELMKLAAGSGICKIVITGDPSGHSFVLDDATFSTEPSCSITGASSPGPEDVQRIINEALGAMAPVDDLNGDSLVNAVDIQIVLNAALGLTCLTH